MERDGRHRPFLPGELGPRAVRPRGHGVGIRERISAGGLRGLSRCGHGGSARPGRDSARPGNLRQRGSDRPGPRRRAGRAAVLTGGQPGYATPGSSQRVPYVLDVHNGSAASDLEDILSSADGPQEGSLTLGRPDNWYMVLATFVPAGASTTTTSPGSTTTTPPTTTTTSTSTTTTTTLPGTTSGVTSSANPSVSGQPVTFTATVKARTAGAGIPTGTVTFNDGPSA